MATYEMYSAVALTGATSLQSINASGLVDGDCAVAYVPTSFRSYLYVYDDDSAGAWGSPYYITPTSGTNERWVLSYIYGGGLGLIERKADPPEPAEGEIIIWVSDSTGAHAGDDGDVMIAGQFGGVTKYGTLWDHSAGAAW